MEQPQAIRKGAFQRKGEFFVYLLKRPDGRVFYVGKGHRIRRINAHFQEAAKETDNHRCHVIRKIWSSGSRVGVEIIFWTDDENEAFQKEIETIAYYGKVNLTNLTDGGEGHAGYSPSEETRRKASLRHRGNKYNLGRQQSEDERRKRAISNTGKKRTKEFCEAISKRMKGNKNATGVMRSPEYCEKQRLAWRGRKVWWGAKAGASLRGRKESEEHRRRISEGLIKAYAEGRRSRRGEKHNEDQ